MMMTKRQVPCRTCNMRSCMCFQIIISRRGQSNSTDHRVSEEGPLIRRTNNSLAFTSRLFAPTGVTGVMECPIDPDKISQERTTHLIDAVKCGYQTYLKKWRLTSQANQAMVNLWTGTTIFTFADNSPKETPSGSAAGRIIDERGRTSEPDPPAASVDEPTSLLLAFGRTHKRLSQPDQLKKLHLQYHHMSADQFRFQTRALHVPKQIYDLFEKVRGECEVCQAVSKRH